MSCLTIPSYYVLSFTGAVPFRPWLKYDVNLKFLEQGREPISYFVETGEPTVMDEEYLGAELFNEALSRVDIADESSLLGFVEKYGIPVSPLYEGHQRLSWYRNRHMVGFVPAQSTRDLRRDDKYQYADLIASFNSDPETGNRHPITGALMPDILFPGLLSEEAREAEVGNSNVKGAVSVLEVAQTIRLLQTAVATCTAYQAEAQKKDTGSVEAAYEYTCKKRFLPTNGVRYFLVDFDLIPYETRLATDERFAANADSWKREGGNPEASYAVTEIEAFHNAASHALTFLNCSQLVSRLPLTLPNSNAGIRNSSSLFRRQPTQDHGELLAEVSAYGSLTEAIVQQYLSLASAPSPWQECEQCGKFFKRPKGAKAGKKLRTTRFCSHSCNVAFNRRRSAE